MVVSEVAFLLLESEKKQKNICKLKVYASLYSLERIERDFDVPNKISFFWRANKAKVRC
jgi:hypothetical protein